MMQAPLMFIAAALATLDPTPAGTDQVFWVRATIPMRSEVPVGSYSSAAALLALLTVHPDGTMAYQSCGFRITSAAPLTLLMSDRAGRARTSAPVVVRGADGTTLVLPTMTMGVSGGDFAHAVGEPVIAAVWGVNVAELRVAFASHNTLTLPPGWLDAPQVSASMRIDAPQWRVPYAAPSWLTVALTVPPGPHAVQLTRAVAGARCEAAPTAP